jgi:hypothetical protein
MFMKAFLFNRCIATLFDLQSSLCKEFQVEKFHELQIGPLLAQPLVQQLFSLDPSLTDVPVITAVDVIKHLKRYSACTPHREKLDVEKFMSSLAQEHQFGSARNCCVKTNHFFPGCVFKMFGVVSRQEREMLASAEATLKKELKEEIEASSRTTSETLLQDFFSRGGVNWFEPVVNFIVKYRAMAKFQSFQHVHHLLPPPPFAACYVFPQLLSPALPNFPPPISVHHVSLQNIGNILPVFHVPLLFFLFPFPSLLLLACQAHYTRTKTASKPSILSFQMTKIVKNQLKSTKKDQDQISLCATALLYLSDGPVGIFFDKLLAKSPGSVPKEDIAEVLFRIVEDVSGSDAKIDDAEIDIAEINGLDLMLSAERKLRREFGDVQVSDLGHGSFVELLGLLDPLLVLRTFSLHGSGHYESSEAPVKPTSESQAHEPFEYSRCFSMSEIGLLAEITAALSKEALSSPFDDVEGVLATVRRLARVEKQVVHTLGGGGFHHAGKHVTFGAFLHQHLSSLNTVLRRTLTPPLKASLTDVANFVKVFLNRSEDGGVCEVSRTKCTRALCLEFGVNQVCDLGFGDLSDVMTHSRMGSDVPIISSMRALASDIGTRSAPLHNPLDCSNPDVVLRCLQAAPYLVDLHSWLQWPAVFEPRHGSLRSFIQREVKPAAQLAFLGLPHRH